MSRSEWFCWFRSIWIGLWIFTLIYITIADYAWDLSLGENVFWDPHMWWHEVGIVILIFGVVLDLSLWWENRWTRSLNIYRVVRLEKQSE